ncbi:transglycosylase domain-containing protein, partial [Beijerinckia sp. L45]|uniref:transglycosylase domain-containing protein n=1 Tax=Beijerinckia sp. L45 TaxID=1641855 RepID=UPI00131AF6F9
RKRRRTSLLGMMIRWTLVLGVWVAIAGGGAIAYYAAKLPPIDQLTVPKRPPNIAIMSMEGTLLANRGDTGGAAIRIADLPPYLPKAFVAIEDRRFYSHFGIDPLGILRALVRNVTGHGGMQGGSTLTQQLAKNLFLTQERTASRKVQEAILALWLEHKYNKTQILELYLNRVYFGSGAFGVEAAARRYFGHGAKDVSLQEAAMLAGLMKAPTKLAPNRNPEAAVERAAQVVTAMKEEGFITDGMMKLALAKPAKAVLPVGAGSANYAADYVVDTLDDTIGAIEDDIVVSTTISQPLQAFGEKALTDELDKKGGKFGVSQGAMVAMDPDGSIRVLIGGRNYAESQYDRAVSAKRQPGSSFKPFVYLAGLERGLTPDTLRDDAPINVHGWQPENYHHDYMGPVTLTKALSLSLNTVAVRIGVEAGPKAVIADAHRLGITSELQPNASIALGTSEVSPLEMVTAYVPFANGGIGVQPHIITKIKTASGKLLYQRKPGNNGRVIDARYVPMMNTMLTETLLTGTARKGAIPGWETAGKTGTSQDWRDAWFVGYTSRLVTGVWLGNDDSSPTKKASGGTLPVEIWSRFMTQAMGSEPPTPLPLGLWRGAPPDRPTIFGIPVPGTEAPDPGPMASAPPPRPRNWQGDEQASYGYRQAPDAPRYQPAPRQARRDDLVPPADIPGDGDDYRRAGPSTDNRSVFDKLFGG